MPTLCDPMNYIKSMEFSRPEYRSGYPFPSPGDLPNSGIEPRYPTLQADSLPAETPGKPKKNGVGSLALLQQIFLTQELNQGVLHCRLILYQLELLGKPLITIIQWIYNFDLFNDWHVPQRWWWRACKKCWNLGRAIWNMCFWVAGIRIIVLDLNLWLYLEGSWQFRYTVQERKSVLLLILGTMLWYVKCLLKEYFPGMVLIAIDFCKKKS